MTTRNIYKSIYVIFFVSIFFWGCSNPESIIDQFDDHSKLYANKTVSLEKLYIKYPKIINLTDSLLILTSSAMGYSNTDYLIFIISKKTGK